MKKRGLRQDNSGQVIIVTALLVASLLLSTSIYIIETEKTVPTTGTDINNVLTQYEQSSGSTLISALANVTNGGNPDVLSFDLNELNTVITSFSYQGIVQMNYIPLNDASYQNGIWISWGTDGQGISSAYVSFVFNSSAASAASNMAFDSNVTTEVNVNGNYQPLHSGITQINLTVNVLNEGNPALAQNFTFYFENTTGGWNQVNSPAIDDFGNGTYAVSFTAQTGQLSSPLTVSTLCQDQRGITVKANVTCSSTG